MGRNDAIGARYERELERQHVQFTAEIGRLQEAHAREIATMQGMLDMLHKILNPVHVDAPPELALTEEAEHLAFAMETKTADPHLVSALTDIGLDPEMTIEPATD